MKHAPQLAALCGLLIATPCALPAQEEKPARRSAPEGTPQPAPPAGDGRPEAPSSPRGERGRPQEGRPPPGRPAPEAQERGKDRVTERGRPESKRPAEPRRDSPSETARGLKQDEGKRVSFIGVLTAPLSPETRGHLRLPEGFGLRVVEVLRESPAMRAGIQENDILVKFEDQRLTSMEQLQALVREKPKGARVSLNLIHSGDSKEVSLEIGETTVPARSEGAGRGPRFLAPHMGQGYPSPDTPRAIPGEGMDLRRQMEEWRERFDQQQKAWREWHERLQQWSREHGRHFPQPPGLPGFDKEGAASSNRREEALPHSRQHDATVTRSDDSGIYTLKKHDGKHIFTAQPRNGEPRTWNLDREEDRRSIPEPMREKLRLLEEIRQDHQHHETRQRGEAEKDGIRVPGDQRSSRGDAPRDPL